MPARRPAMSISVTSIPGMTVLAGAMNRWAGEIRSTKPVLKEAVDEVIRPRIRSNFATERAGNDPWKRLSETTIRDRQNKGYDSGPILNRSGTLSQAAQQANIWQFNGQAGEAFVTELPGRAWYGVVHDQGLLEPQVPTRSFFAITDRDMEKIEEIFVEWVSDNFNKTVGLVAGRKTLGGLM